MVYLHKLDFQATLNVQIRDGTCTVKDPSVDPRITDCSVYLPVACSVLGPEVQCCSCTSGPYYVDC